MKCLLLLLRYSTARGQDSTTESLEHISAKPILYSYYSRLLRGGRLIIMDWTEKIEWHQTHGNHGISSNTWKPWHFIKHMETMEWHQTHGYQGMASNTHTPAITTSPSSSVKVPPTSCDSYIQYADVYFVMYPFVVVMSTPANRVILVQQPFMERRVSATFLRQWPDQGEHTHAIVTSPQMGISAYPHPTVGTAADLITYMLGMYSVHNPRTCVLS